MHLGQEKTGAGYPRSKRDVLLSVEKSGQSKSTGPPKKAPHNMEQVPADLGWEMAGTQKHISQREPWLNVKKINISKTAQVKDATFVNTELTHPDSGWGTAETDGHAILKGDPWLNSMKSGRKKPIKVQQKPHTNNMDSRPVSQQYEIIGAQRRIINNNPLLSGGESESSKNGKDQEKLFANTGLAPVMQSGSKRNEPQRHAIMPDPWFDSGKSKKNKNPEARETQLDEMGPGPGWEITEARRHIIKGDPWLTPGKFGKGKGTGARERLFANMGPTPMSSGSGWLESDDEFSSNSNKRKEDPYEKYKNKWIPLKDAMNYITDNPKGVIVDHPVLRNAPPEELVQYNSDEAEGMSESELFPEYTMRKKQAQKEALARRAQKYGILEIDQKYDEVLGENLLGEDSSSSSSSSTGTIDSDDGMYDMDMNFYDEVFGHGNSTLNTMRPGHPNTNDDWAVLANYPDNPTTTSTTTNGSSRNSAYNKNAESMCIDDSVYDEIFNDTTPQNANTNPSTPPRYQNNPFISSDMISNRVDSGRIYRDSSNRDPASIEDFYDEILGDVQSLQLGRKYL
ncbi:hypothetical protein H4219_002805 [Mycoemilia scoparia]|uniref:Uncharacterized protein n=1 Tax=Mycoemilia scoparia TaxID=417184 RepID=A0A9W8DQ32_9FUNG|nr:hypothetical protein H4219_002805 [Mycoemilia scoparia]